MSRAWFFFGGSILVLLLELIFLIKDQKELETLEMEEEESRRNSMSIHPRFPLTLFIGAVLILLLSLVIIFVHKASFLLFLYIPLVSAFVYLVFLFCLFIKNRVGTRDAVSFTSLYYSVPVMAITLGLVLLVLDDYREADTIIAELFIWPKGMRIILYFLPYFSFFGVLSAILCVHDLSDPRDAKFAVRSHGFSIVGVIVSFVLLILRLISEPWALISLLVGVILMCLEGAWMIRSFFTFKWHDIAMGLFDPEFFQFMVEDKRRM